jgi:LPS-assembly lipoprotein
MWWARTLVLLAPLLVSACGFHPLYAGGKGDAVASKMADVAIGNIPDRSGQILRNNLLDRMHPKGESGETRYSLSVALSEARSDLGLQRDASSTYARLYVYARFTLQDQKTGELLLDQTSTVITSFSLPSGGFVNLVSEADARDRALAEISDEIATRIAVFLRRKS